MGAAYCVRCGAALTGGGSLCIRCGRTNADPGPPTSGRAPGTAPPPAVPIFGFRHPRDTGSTWRVIVVLLAALLVAASMSGFLFYSLIGFEPRINPDITPIGTAFAPAAPTLGSCPNGSTFASQGCEGPSHYVYGLSIRTSTVRFGSVRFQVFTPTGHVAGTSGGLGFTVLAGNGSVLAQYLTSDGNLTMPSGWTYAPGTAASTLLLVTDSIRIDVGLSSPLGEGWSFVADGLDGYDGTTYPLSLP
jgi:hypothetical protein